MLPSILMNIRVIIEEENNIGCQGVVVMVEVVADADAPFPVHHDTWCLLPPQTPVLPSIQG